jgi:hypothetical protein
MWRNVFLLTLLFCFCFGWHCSSQPAPKAAAETDGGILIGKSVTQKNLTIFPLYLKQAKDVPDYITLDEALSAKSVEVREVGARREEPSGQAPQQQPAQEQQVMQQQEQVQVEGAGARVNAVEVENKSDRTLYILAGQVIIGGKQDRVLARDTIIPAGKKIQVEVCCVEHGRWSPRRQQQAYAFDNVSTTNAQVCLKKAMVFEGASAQRKVWDEVQKESSKMGAETPTQTYKEVIEKTDKTVAEFVEAVEKLLGSDKEICGFLVFVNGEIETCDLFASPKLLQKFKSMLLRGYALDSIAAEKKEKIAEVTVEAAKEFMNDTVAAQKTAQTLLRDEYRRIDKIEGKRIIGVINSDGKAVEGAHINAYQK